MSNIRNSCFPVGLKDKDLFDKFPEEIKERSDLGNRNLDSNRLLCT